MIRASARTTRGRRILIGLTDVNMRRLDRGGDEGLGEPLIVKLADCVPPEARGEPVGDVDLVVFYASRESILLLAETMGQDAKGMLDQLGEGMTRRVDADGLRRNRTTTDDLDLLVRVADVGGSLELRLEADGRTCALVMPANGGRAYSARGLTPARAVRALRDELERLAGN